MRHKRDGVAGLHIAERDDDVACRIDFNVLCADVAKPLRAVFSAGLFVIAESGIATSVRISSTTSSCRSLT